MHIRLPWRLMKMVKKLKLRWKISKTLGWRKMLIQQFSYLPQKKPISRNSNRNYMRLSLKCILSDIPIIIYCINHEQAGTICRLGIGRLSGCLGSPRRDIYENGGRQER